MGDRYRPCATCPSCGTVLHGLNPEEHRRIGASTEGAIWCGGEELLHPVDRGYVGDGRHSAVPTPWAAETEHIGDTLIRGGRIVARYGRDPDRPVRRAADFGPMALVPVIPCRWLDVDEADAS